MTPQARSLEFLRKNGLVAESVERWTRFPDRKRACSVCGAQPMISLRKDLFGFADIFAAGRDGIYFIQVTSRAHHAERLSKILNDSEIAPNALLLLNYGMKILVHSWALEGPRGERKLWKLRVDEVTQNLFGAKPRAYLAAENIPLPF